MCPVEIVEPQRTGWDCVQSAPDHFQIGDVVHVKNVGWFSRMIRLFTRSKADPHPSWASHSAMIYALNGQVMLIEAVIRGVKVRPITKYRGKPQILVYRKDGGLTDQQKQGMINKARYYRNKGYSRFRILTHMLDGLFGGIFFFRRINHPKEYPICSWLVAFIYDRILSFHFHNQPPEAAQPDDLLDECVYNHWPCVWADSPETVDNLRNTYS